MDIGVGNAIAGGVSALGNTVSTLFTNASNERINKRNLAWQTEENQKAREWNEKMIAEQNAYNTPSAQKQRLLDAGINPWLSDSSVTSQPAASSAPPQTAHSAPAALPMQAPRIGSDLASVIQLALNDKAVNANSANQQAQGIQSLVESAVMASKYFGASAGRDLLDKFLPLVSSNGDFSQSYGGRLLRADLGVREAQWEYEEINTDLLKKFGAPERQAVINDFDRKFEETVAQVGLWANLTKLNDSNVKVNDARIKNLAEQTLTEFTKRLLNKGMASFYANKGVTEQQMREWLVSRIKYDVYSQAMNLLEQEADFSEGKALRNYKHSDAAQLTRVGTYVLSPENNVPFKFVKELEGMVTPWKSAPSSVPKKWANPIPKAQIKRNFMQPNGYKGQRIDYEYYPGRWLTPPE